MGLIVHFLPSTGAAYLAKAGVEGRHLDAVKARLAAD
jgi:hypothetical protein